MKRYKIADIVIEVDAMYDKFYEYCKDYETDEPADIFIKITPEDVAYEKLRTESERAFEGLPAPDYPDDLFETTAVYRKLGEKAPDHGAAIFHGSVIAVDGTAYLFTAKSGVGKSTHARLWREYFGDRAVMINDDKPILKITDAGVVAYGTPYTGKHRLGCNASAPLKAICILTRGEKNSIVRIGSAEAYPMLLQQIYRPADPAQMAKTLEIADRLASEVELYRLACNTDPEAAEVAYNGMKG